MTSGTGSDEARELSTREKIAEVRAAIHQLAIGRVKSYQIGRRTVTYYDLKALKEYLNDLLAQLEAEEGDPSRMASTRVAYFDRR